MKIIYDENKKNSIDYIKLLFVDTLVFVFTMTMVNWFSAIDNFLDVLIVIVVFNGFTGLQLLNISVNFKKKNPGIRMLSLQILNVNRTINLIPVLFIVTIAPVYTYPIFIGIFLFTGIFNTMIQLTKSSEGYYRIESEVNDNGIIIISHAKLLYFDKSWVEEITDLPLKYRVMKEINTLMSTQPIFYQKETFDKAKETQSSIENANIVYKLHVLKSEKSGEEITIDKQDRIILIYVTRNLDEIFEIIDKMKLQINIQYSFFHQ